jgi:hypothetical protein
MKKQLSQYLDHPLNIKLYQILNNHYADEHIEPLKFFQAIERDMIFFIQNYEYYLKIEDYFKKPDLIGRHRYFYFHSVHKWIENEFDAEKLEKGVLCECFGIIKQAIANELNMPRSIKTISDGFGFWFSDVKAYLENIRDYKEKRKLLIKLKYDCLQVTESVGKLAPRNYHTFPNDCDLELKKLDASDNINVSKIIVNLTEMQVPTEIKPKFRKESIEPIFTILKEFFSQEEQKELKLIISTGENAHAPLIFKDNGNRLADAFKQLFNANFVIACQKKDFEKWISVNFKYTHRRKIKTFKLHYLSDIISTTSDKCKKPILDVKSGKIETINN